jgi:hypothetical protein
MTGIEQDQEKILNASSQVAQNTLSTVVNLRSLRKTPTKVEIKTSRDAVKGTQELLKKGTQLETIKNYLVNSSIAKRVVSAGGNLGKYVDLIVKKAQINNNINQSVAPEKLPKVSKRL